MKKKKITQDKRANKTRTKKDPTPRNKWRKAMKGLSSSKKLKTLRYKAAQAKL